MVAFNKNIADELKQRSPSYVEVFTLHSLGFRAIKQTFGNVVLDNDKAKKIVQSIIGEDNDLWDLNQSICKCISLCKGFLIDAPVKINDLIDKFDIENFELTRPKFIEIVIKALSLCKDNKTIIDFDDMVWFPFVHRLNVGKFDIVFVDEAQDLNIAQMAMVLSASKIDGRIMAVGDPAQCVDENTILNIDGDSITVKNCKSGQLVGCYNNGKLDFKKITNKVKSKWQYGYEITTSSGNKLLMSPNHKIWASPALLGKNEYVVYLMYRKDLGFRVGKTNRWKRTNNFLGQRTASERADRLWVLDIASSNEDAILLEEKYSLKYGVPTCVFNGKFRNLNQDRIDKIFYEFGQNGFSLLKDKELYFEYPHWAASSNSFVNRRIIRLNAHAKKGTQVSLEWKDPDLDQLFESKNITFSKAKNSRIRKFFSNYKDALFFADKIAKLSGGYINERLSIAGENPYLITASGLHVGMKVYSLHENSFIEEYIVNIERKNGIFYDLEVENAANFIGNNILSHNSIYQFRGADSESIPKFINQLKAKTLPLSLTYRCPKKVIKLAQEIVPDIKCPDSAEDGIVEHIYVEELLKKVKAGDFVLSRTNAPLIRHCMALLKQGIPANIQGRDIGANLQYFVKKSKSKTINKLIEYINNWKQQEIDRLTLEKKDPGIAIDKAECLLNLCEEASTIKDLQELIDNLFNDIDDNKKVIFSTTHKAKGLERDRVFILVNTYRYGPGVEGEEANLWYTAVTRAKKELYLVRKQSKYEQYDNFDKSKLKS
jgi:intein/homing endonuclease